MDFARSSIVLLAMNFLPGPWQDSHVTPSSGLIFSDATASVKLYAVAWHCRHLPLFCGSSTPAFLPISLALSVPRVSNAFACGPACHLPNWFPESSFLWQMLHIFTPT